MIGTRADEVKGTAVLPGRILKSIIFSILRWKGGTASEGIRSGPRYELGWLNAARVHDHIPLDSPRNPSVTWWALFLLCRRSSGVERGSHNP
jgi:hypothetical protein